MTAREGDTRGTPILFDASTEGLAMNGRAVMHLGVGESLLWTSQRTHVMLPELTVRY